jgi:hypothetical protein
MGAIKPTGEAVSQSAVKSAFFPLKSLNAVVEGYSLRAHPQVPAISGQTGPRQAPYKSGDTTELSRKIGKLKSKHDPPAVVPE